MSDITHPTTTGGTSGRQPEDRRSRRPELLLFLAAAVRGLIAGTVRELLHWILEGH